MLTDTLRTQHQELVRLVQQMDAALEREDEAEARAVLASLGQALRTHLTLEDQEIYPGLIRAAEASSDEKMLESAKAFSSNMLRITEALRDFVSRHESDFHLERFRAGWRTLSDVLARRIESEEKTLYPLYEQRVLRKP